MNVKKEKAHVRKVALACRDALDGSIAAAKSAQICRAVEELVEEACGRREARRVEGGGYSGCGTALAPTPLRSRPPLLALYAAMRSEVNLEPLAQAAWERGWDVCFPCMVRDEPEAPSRMVFHRVPRERVDEAREAFLAHPLRCLSCGELERAGFPLIQPEELDVVCVPLVAFDEAGNRLGYGGGNYDRLLTQLRPDTLVLGTAFEEQRVPAVPCEPHDQPLPHIVSA